ncbi:MAG TPA: rod shape-determining protein MreD [Sphingomicrobium sp.]|jgi:rod shape-determining protein MreD|nr:rod shape-determining protein MreD [Sphingomicrobium sp.]
MARAALSTGRRIGQGPKPLAGYVPALTVALASLLAALPIVSTSGWYPDFGFLAMISWRLLRSDPWPVWWAAPMGLVNDLFTGFPIGFSVTLWSATMLALDLVDRRTMWRDYWIEWGLAAVLLAADEWLQWRIAALGGARVPFLAVVPPLVISICVFPLSAWIVSRLDRWRLGR